MTDTYPKARIEKSPTEQPKDYPDIYITGNQKFLLCLIGIAALSIGAICLAYVGGEKIKADAMVESDKLLSNAAAKEWALKFGPGRGL